MPRPVSPAATITVRRTGAGAITANAHLMTLQPPTNPGRPERWPGASPARASTARVAIEAARQAGAPPARTGSSKVVATRADASYAQGLGAGHSELMEYGTGYDDRYMVQGGTYGGAREGHGNYATGNTGALVPSSTTEIDPESWPAMVAAAARRNGTVPTTREHGDQPDLGTTASQAVEELVGRLGGLPSMPGHLVRLDAALADPDCTAGQVADIVVSDVGVSAKVLQLVNSTTYGLRCKISDLRQAVAYLGTGTIRDIALADAAFRAFKPSPVLPRSWLEDLNNHATLASKLAGQLSWDVRVQCQATVAALMHPIGELVIAEKAPNVLVEIATQVSHGADRAEVQDRLLGTTYEEIGAHLLRQWRMGGAVADAVANYRKLYTGQERGPDLPDVVLAADVLAHETAPHEDLICPGSVPGLDDDYLRTIGLWDVVTTIRRSPIAPARA